MAMDAGRGIALVGTEATGLGQFLMDSGAGNNPYMINSANKKVYQIFIFNNVEILKFWLYIIYVFFYYEQMDLKEF